MKRILLLAGIVIFCCLGCERAEITGKDGARMVLIPSGDFEMGSSDINSDVREKPLHTVYVDVFYMDKYAVTNAQYRKFVEATDYKQPKGYSIGTRGEWLEFRPWLSDRFNRDNHPVVCVNWEDANAYAKWASKRLPTEAEWEKAARGGLLGKKYPWGDKLRHDNANYFGVEGNDVWDFGTAPVGSFAPNSYGLHDMAGNIWEWCADWYDKDYYKSSPRQNPTGPVSGTYRVLRGGTWGQGPDLQRVAHRGALRQGIPESSFQIGFRCVQNIE